MKHSDIRGREKTFDLYRLPIVLERESYYLTSFLSGESTSAGIDRAHAESLRRNLSSGICAAAQLCG